MGHRIKRGAAQRSFCHRTLSSYRRGLTCTNRKPQPLAAYVIRVTG